MGTYYVRSKVYRYETDGHYSDLIGAIVENANDSNSVFLVKKAEFRSFFARNSVVNATLSMNNILRHRKGTVEFSQVLEKGVRSKQSKIDGMSKVHHLTGDSLKNYIEGVLSKIKCRRHEYVELEKYLSGKADYVLALYGLRRTGKTYLMLQGMKGLLKRVSTDKCVFASATSANTMQDIYELVHSYVQKGVLYFFIDEITYIKDFVTCSANLANLYTKMGIKIVISGTHSLGIALAAREELYDRVKIINIGYLSFKEQHKLTGCSLKQYVRNGGVMLGDIENYKRYHDYIDSSVVRNITNSLRYSKGSVHSLSDDFFDVDKMTSAVGRVLDFSASKLVSDIFTCRFKSHRVSSALQILGEKRKEAQIKKVVGIADKGTKKVLRDTEVVEVIDIDNVTDAIKLALEIRDYDKPSVSDYYLREVRGFLRKLGVIETIKGLDSGIRDLIVVPWLVYNQVVEILDALEEDQYRAAVAGKIVNYNLLMTKVREDADGRLLENIIVSDTKRRLRGMTVTQYYSGATGCDLDMVVATTDMKRVYLFEIKRSSKVVPNKQCRNICHEHIGELFDDSTLVRRYVIYSGKYKEVESNGLAVVYLNSEDFLLGKYDKEFK